MKKTLPVSALTLSLALALLLSVGGGLALAQNHKKDHGQDRSQAAERMPAMSPEDRAALEGLWKTHRDQMAPLRDQMWGKKMEYEALVANPNTKPGDVKPLIDEMIQLRVQMRAEQEKFFDQLKDKGYGPEFRHGKGMGMGMGMGHGPAMGMNPCGMMGDRSSGPGHDRHDRDFDDVE